MSDVNTSNAATTQPTSYPKDQIRIVLLEGIHPDARGQLEREGFRVEAADDARTDAAMVETIRDAHVMGIRSKSQIDAAVLKHAEKLLAIGCFCIGTNQVDVAAAASMGIPVFNSPFSNTRSVAELVIAEIIALHRRLFERSAAMHAGRWVKSSAGSHEVRGRTLGIVGYGRIGSQVSVLAEALGMRVIYHDVRPTLALGNARPAASLEALLEASDIVTLHVPATERTQDLIGKHELARMRPGAMLLNNARGSVVDIEALAAALRTGHLGGAAIDVFPQEPATNTEPFESVLRGLGNVILTPHVGGSTKEAQAAIAADVAGKLMRFIDVGTTTGAVNVPEVDLPEQPPTGRGRPHRILHFHRNVPGVLNKLHNVLASHGANVSGEVLRTRDELGYVVLDLDPGDSRPVAEELEAIDETIRVRVLW